MNAKIHKLTRVQGNKDDSIKSARLKMPMPMNYSSNNENDNNKWNDFDNSKQIDLICNDNSSGD